ncbi:MAG TPA: hypothetical protein VJZ71_06690 [Phycisphaerae bacterium]|nr:hypothetical protein [Phycisphaerae bacterium]
MTILKLAGKRRLISSGMAVAFAASVFQTSTCSVTLDQATLDQLSGIVDNVNIIFVTDGDNHHDDHDDDWDGHDDHDWDGDDHDD